MEFHYIIKFDSDTNKWSVENEYDYLPDGNVWDQEREDAGDYGWIVPDEDSLAALIDQRCHNMLNALVTIWPAVDTTPYP